MRSGNAILFILPCISRNDAKEFALCESEQAIARSGYAKVTPSFGVWIGTHQEYNRFRF
jgi:hypothetical protein